MLILHPCTRELGCDAESLRTSHTWTDGADNKEEIPFVKPHPPRQPSSGSRRKPRVKSAGKERTRHTGVNKGVVFCGFLCGLLRNYTLNIELFIKDRIGLRGSTIVYCYRRFAVQSVCLTVFVLPVPVSDEASVPSVPSSTCSSAGSIRQQPSHNAPQPKLIANEEEEARFMREMQELARRDALKSESESGKPAQRDVLKSRVRIR